MAFKGKLRKLGNALTLVGVLSGATLQHGCGLGAYAKDPRAGAVWNEMAQGMWYHETETEAARIQAQGMTDAARTLAGQNNYSGGQGAGNQAQGNVQVAKDDSRDLVSMGKIADKDGLYLSRWVDVNGNGLAELGDDIFQETNIFYPGDSIFLIRKTPPRMTTGLQMYPVSSRSVIVLFDKETNSHNDLQTIQTDYNFGNFSVDELMKLFGTEKDKVEYAFELYDDNTKKLLYRKNIFIDNRN